MLTVDDLVYVSGFGNHFATEALPNTLPQGQNCPQKAPYGLYAEQLSGSAFSAYRHENLRSWFYRIRPSVLHANFKKIDSKLICGRPFQSHVSPEQLRWHPLAIPSQPTDFIDGMATFMGNGSPDSWRGSAIHIYAGNKNMDGRYFYNADGELLIVPQVGTLFFSTECGVLSVTPGEFCVIPRGIKFQVTSPDKQFRGYICENFGLPFRLPYLSIIGANGLANPRDFLTPTAHYEEIEGNFSLITKYGGCLWEASIDHSPLDVVAWHGNYAPYKYDLSRFQTINTVSFDHCDPSIFTVLHGPSEIPGVANVDFVIFPPRWSVSEHSFRPPYYHRNIMSEYMGCVFGVYEAKEEGFLPGGGSLHNSMSAHGPDASAYIKATTDELKPTYIKDTLAIMFESSLTYQPTDFAMTTSARQDNYLECWRKLPIEFPQHRKS